MSRWERNRERQWKWWMVIGDVSLCVLTTLSPAAIKTHRFLHKSSESASSTIPLFSLSEQITLYLSYCESLPLINNKLIHSYWRVKCLKMYNDEWWQLLKIGIQKTKQRKQKYIHFYFSTKQFITSSWAEKDYNKKTNRTSTLNYLIFYMQVILLLIFFFSTQATFLRVMKYNSHAVLLQCHWASAAHSAFYSILSLMIWQQLDSHKGENESLKLWGDDIVRSPQARVLFN